MRKLLPLEKLVNFDVWMKFAKRGDALFINHGSIEVGLSNFLFYVGALSKVSKRGRCYYHRAWRLFITHTRALHKLT